MIKVNLQHEAATKEHEVVTKRAMEITGRAFLKEKMEGSTSLGIPKIVEQVMKNQFVTPTETEVPLKAPMPLP